MKNTLVLILGWLLLPGPKTAAYALAHSADPIPKTVHIKLTLSKVAVDETEVGGAAYRLKVDKSILTTAVADTLPSFVLVADSVEPAALAKQVLSQLRQFAGDPAKKLIIQKVPDWEALLLSNAFSRRLSSTERSAQAAFLAHVEADLAKQAKALGIVLAIAAAPADTQQAIKQNSFQVGIGLGASAALQRTYSYSLSAPNYYLRQEAERTLWPVASAVLCYNPQYYYIKLGDENKPLGQQRTELETGRVGWLAALNFNDAFSSSLSFNQRISLGLGLGISLGEDSDFYLALFAEGRLTRYLRDSYALDAALPAYATSTTTPAPIVTSLNLSDDTYFVTRPVVGFGFKFIYILTGGAPKFPVEVAAKKTDK